MRHICSALFKADPSAPLIGCRWASPRPQVLHLCSLKLNKFALSSSECVVLGSPRNSCLSWVTLERWNRLMSFYWRKTVGEAASEDEIWNKNLPVWERSPHLCRLTGSEIKLRFIAYRNKSLWNQGVQLLRLAGILEFLATEADCEEVENWASLTDLEAVWRIIWKVLLEAVIESSAFYSGADLWNPLLWERQWHKEATWPLPSLFVSTWKVKNSKSSGKHKNTKYDLKRTITKSLPTANSSDVLQQLLKI